MQEQANDPTAVEFKAFCQRHDAMNRWFRSADLSRRIARIHAQKYDPRSPAKLLFDHDRRREDVLKQYRGRFSELGRKPQASIADFLLDLRDGWETILESVIVYEAGALEMYIRGWALSAIEQALTSSKVSRTRSADLLQFKEQIQTTPYRTVSLDRIATLFPSLKLFLNSTTHVRSTRPLLSVASSDLSCRSVADLWREVRNLILHHDRVVHERFHERYSKIWFSMQEEANEQGRRIRPRPCRVGTRLPLVSRHVVFCLTSCYQTAIVLYIAAGGGGPNNSFDRSAGSPFST